MEEQHATEKKVPQKFPKEQYLKKWSWGGFLISGIWALGSRLYPLGVIAILIAFIPFLNLPILLIVGIWLGIKGRKMAWDSGKWKSFEEFRKRQNFLDNLGFILLLVGFVLAFVA